jgi:hypothetical protein
MTVVINGTTGITTPSPVVLEGSTSGTITLAAPAVAGSTTQTLVNVTGTLAPIVSGTAVTASGTSVDFTSIPSWVKRITVAFSAVSTNGSANLQVQIGSTSFTIAGYGGGCSLNSSNATATTGFLTSNGTAVSSSFHGAVVLSLVNLSANLWSSNGVLSSNAGTIGVHVSGGSIALAGTLDRVRVIASATGSPADTFDAGTINILYE